MEAGKPDCQVSTIVDPFWSSGATMLFLQKGQKEWLLWDPLTAGFVFLGLSDIFLMGESHS